MALPRNELSIFLLHFWIILLFLVPFSAHLSQNKQQPPVVVRGSSPEKLDQPSEKQKDDNHIERLKEISRVKPENYAAAPATERDHVLETYHERDTQKEAEDKNNWVRGVGDDTGEDGETYMTVVDEEEIEIDSEVSPVLKDENTLDSVFHGRKGSSNAQSDSHPAEVEIRNNNRKNFHRNLKRKRKKEKRKKYKKQLLKTKQLLLHPHSLEMQNALEHFKSVMTKLGNRSDLLEKFMPSREMNKKTHSFIKQLRKLKKVSQKKHGQTLRKKREVSLNLTPLSPKTVLYLKSIGFTPDDLKYYYYGILDITHADHRSSNSGNNENSLNEGEHSEPVMQVHHKSEKSARLKRMKRQIPDSISDSVNRDKRGVKEVSGKPNSPSEKSTKSENDELPPEILNEIKSVMDHELNVENEKKPVEIQKRDDGAKSNGKKKDKKSKLSKSQITKSESDIVEQITTKITEKTEENKEEVESIISSPETQSPDSEQNPSQHDQSLKKHSTNSPSDKNGVKSSRRSEPQVDDAANLKQNPPLKTETTDGGDATSTVLPGADESVVDCSGDRENLTACLEKEAKANYVFNIAVFKTIMQDRSRDAVYGMISLGLIVGTVLLAVLYTQMWKHRRDTLARASSVDDVNNPHIKIHEIREVIKSKARYLPMFHKKWKRRKKYKQLAQDSYSDSLSSEDEVFDQELFKKSQTLR